MTKEQILEAAAQIFRQKGFHAASMHDIAEAVNLQKASLYHHVTSKQEILLDLLNQAIDLLTERMIAVLQQDLPAREKLRAAIRCYLETLAERSDLVSVMILEYRSLDPEYLAQHISRRDRFERLWRDLVKEGFDSGEFCATDPAMTARSLLGVMNWTITWYRPSGPMSIQQIADEIASLFLTGLLCRS